MTYLFFLGDSWRVKGMKGGIKGATASVVESNHRMHHTCGFGHFMILKTWRFKQVSSTAAHGFCGSGQDKMMPCATMALGIVWDPEKWPSRKQIWSHASGKAGTVDMDRFRHVCCTWFSKQGEAMLLATAFWMKYCKTATVPQNKLSYMISLTKSWILPTKMRISDIFSSKNTAKIEFPAPPSTIWKCFWILLFLTCTATLSADNYDNHQTQRVDFH